MLINLGGVVVAEDNSQLEIKVERILTGTTPFNEDDGPGNDSSEDNAIVRTTDIVSYDIQYSVINENQIGQNVVLKSTLPVGINGELIAIWDESLSSDPNVVISDEGRTFEYQLGEIQGGTAYSLSPSYRVLGNAQNGEAISLNFQLASSNLGSMVTNTQTTYVSALPKIDLSIDSNRVDQVQDENGNWGYAINYKMLLSIKDGKGSEQLAGNVEFEADLSNFGIPNAKLYTEKGGKAAAINGDGYVVSTAPLGRIGMESDASRSVANSGQLRVEQQASGENLHFTISGMDSSGNHKPLFTREGNSLSSDETIIFSGYFSIFLAQEDLAEGQNTTTIELNHLEVNGKSGSCNFGTGLEQDFSNNIKIFDIEKRLLGDGRFGFRIDYNTSFNKNTKLDTMTSYISGDGTVVPGQHFVSSAFINNYGTVPLTEVIFVTKFDGTKMKLLPSEENNAPIDLAVSGKGDVKDWVIEYGIKAFENPHAIMTSSAEESDSETGIWYDDLKTAENIGVVSMVRAKLKTGLAMPIGDYVTLKLNFEANGAKGDVLPIYAAAKAKEANAGKWMLGQFDAESNEGAGTGQRLFVNDVNARIVKETSPAGISNINVTGGEQILEYVLKPSFTTDSKVKAGTLAQAVIITDTIGKGQEYLAASATIEPQSIQKLENGQTELKWILGDLDINQAIEEIAYKTKTDFDLKNQALLTSTAIIETQSDISDIQKRKSALDIRVINNSGWAIKEYTPATEIEINGDLEYRLAYTNFINQDLNQLTFISKMPYLGDSIYQGERYLKNIESFNGEDIWLTFDEESDIDINPQSNKNQWYRKDTLTAEEKKKATAIKVESTIFPKDQPTREIIIQLGTIGNQTGDTYYHQTSAYTETIKIPIYSKKVAIEVVSSQLGQLVWEDANENGIRDAGEKALKGVELLLKSSEGMLRKSRTDEQGIYRFDHLKSGEYEISVNEASLPKGYQLVYDPDLKKDNQVKVQLALKEKLSHLNFGYAKTKIKPLEKPSQDPEGDGIEPQKTDTEPPGTETSTPPEQESNQESIKKGLIEIQYIDVATGEMLLESKQMEGILGEKYKTKAEDIEQYMLVDRLGQEEDSYQIEKKTVIYYYGKIINIELEKEPKGTLKVEKGILKVQHKALDNNKLLLPEQVSQGLIGVGYETQAANIEAYRLAKLPQNDKGVYVKGETRVIYYYEKVEIPSLKETVTGRRKLPQTGESYPYETTILGFCLILLAGGLSLKKWKSIN